VISYEEEETLYISMPLTSTVSFIIAELVSNQLLSSRTVFRIMLSSKNLHLTLACIFSLIFVHPLIGLPLNGDDLCQRTGDTLCVRDVLMIIAAMTKNINRTINQVETDIIHRVQTIDTLNRYINFELGVIHTRLPSPQYHMRFVQMNNIDQVILNVTIVELKRILFNSELSWSTAIGSTLCFKYLLQFFSHSVK
jgi:hypothetical protein